MSDAVSCIRFGTLRHTLFVILWMVVAAVGCSAPEVSRPDVTQIRELEYKVTRRRLDTGLMWLRAPEQGRYDYFVPHERAGVVVGLKVYGIRRGSLASQVGLRNGDMIEAVNGVPVTDYLSNRDALQRDDHFEIVLERKGEELKLVLWIDDAS